MNFKPLSDHELNLLGDDQLIDYIRAARDADPEAGRRGLAILVYGHMPRVERRIRLKVRRQGVSEDLAHEALVRAISSAFDGRSVGQFHSWLNTIVDRTVFDYFRAQKRRPDPDPLPSENQDDEQLYGTEPGVESETGAVEVRIVTDEVLAQFNDIHRLVIELHVFAELTAPEVCERIQGMSEANVAQIASRFRKKLRGRLDVEGGGT